MVDALNRLYLTDALVENTRRPSEVGAPCQPRGHGQSNSHAQAYPMEADTITSTESNHHHNHEAASDTESGQLHWDPEKLMMTVTPWWTKTGPLWYPYHGKDGRKDTGKFGKFARFSHRTWLLQTRDKPVQESRAKNNVREGTTETRPKHPHTIPRQSERSQHRTCHWSRAEKTHSLLPLPTTWTHGERVSESSTEGHSQSSAKNFFCQEMPLHNCITCHLTCCLMVRPRLLWDATPIRSTLSLLV